VHRQRSCEQRRIGQGTDALHKMGQYGDAEGMLQYVIPNCSNE
ncbi:hypothetical protein NPIL_79391, partial [Nephila pilipes]